MRQAVRLAVKSVGAREGGRVGRGSGRAGGHIGRAGGSGGRLDQAGGKTSGLRTVVECGGRRMVKRAGEQAEEMVVGVKRRRDERARLAVLADRKQTRHSMCVPRAGSPPSLRHPPSPLASPAYYRSARTSIVSSTFRSNI